MGRRGGWWEFDDWRKRCVTALGREVRFGEKLSRWELRKLGYTRAAAGM